MGQLKELCRFWVHDKHAVEKMRKSYSTIASLYEKKQLDLPSATQAALILLGYTKPSEAISNSTLQEVVDFASVIEMNAFEPRTTYEVKQRGRPLNVDLNAEGPRESCNACKRSLPINCFKILREDAMYGHRKFRNKHGELTHKHVIRKELEKRNMLNYICKMCESAQRAACKAQLSEEEKAARRAKAAAEMRAKRSPLRLLEGWGDLQELKDAVITTLTTELNKLGISVAVDDGGCTHKVHLRYLATFIQARCLDYLLPELSVRMLKLILANDRLNLINLDGNHIVLGKGALKVKRIALHHEKTNELNQEDAK